MSLHTDLKKYINSLPTESQQVVSDFMIQLEEAMSPDEWKEMTH
jgi:hypothetical protein